MNVFGVEPNLKGRSGKGKHLIFYIWPNVYTGTDSGVLDRGLKFANEVRFEYVPDFSWNFPWKWKQTDSKGRVQDPHQSQNCLHVQVQWLIFHMLKQVSHFFFKWNEPRHDKTNKIRVIPAKTQISLGICLVWSESSLCIQWVAKDPRFPHADSEDSDQTGRMPRLIWVFAGWTATLLVLSCRGSNWISIKECNKANQRCSN